jgi:chromosome segregation ATPase
MEDVRSKTSRREKQSADLMAGLERRVEKVEKMMQIGDEESLLKLENEENKQFEVDRRLDSIDNRLRRIEQAISHFVIDLEDKLEQHESQISSIKQIPMLKSELEDLKCSFYTDERIAALEKEISLKMLQMFETIEELSRNASYKEKEIERLKIEIGELRSENEKVMEEREEQAVKIKELINQMEEIWMRQEILDSQLGDKSMQEEELERNTRKDTRFKFQ